MADFLPRKGRKRKTRIKRNKQVEAAEAAEAATIKAMHDAANYMTVAEREKAQRMRLYATLKAHNALETYYDLYPDERPKADLERLRREQEGGERGD